MSGKEIACVPLAVCNYSDIQGNCPPSLTTKRILIQSGLTVPGGDGVANQRYMENNSSKLPDIMYVSCDGQVQKRKAGKPLNLT